LDCGVLGVLAVAARSGLRGVGHEKREEKWIKKSEDYL
jgi:hypothetical protein